MPTNHLARLSGRRPCALNIPDAAAARADWADSLIRAAHTTHAVQLVRLALLLVGDRPSAEDVVQDAFLGSIRRCPGCAIPTRSCPISGRP
jgi:Sigma-70 region 2